MKRLWHLLFSIAVCEGVGVLGAFFTVSQIASWYQTLQKPTFSPPNWLFGPVWTALYALMGIAMFLVWQKTSGLTRTRATVIFGIQLVLNFSWSVIFFGWHQPLLALIDIALLWLAIGVTIIVFAKYSKLAATLLIPYLLWVSFASLLNFAIVTLN